MQLLSECQLTSLPGLSLPLRLRDRRALSDLRRPIRLVWSMPARVAAQTLPILPALRWRHKAAEWPSPQRWVWVERLVLRLLLVNQPSPLLMVILECPASPGIGQE